MTSRSFLLVLAAVSGTPLLAAGLILCCPSTTAAVIACLALAAGGMLGAGASILLIADRGVRSADSLDISEQLRERAAFSASVDQDTSAAIGDAIQQLNTRQACS